MALQFFVKTSFPKFNRNSSSGSRVETYDARTDMIYSTCVQFMHVVQITHNKAYFVDTNRKQGVKNMR